MLEGWLLELMRMELPPGVDGEHESSLGGGLGIG